MSLRSQSHVVGASLYKGGVSLSLGDLRRTPTGKCCQVFGGYLVCSLLKVCLQVVWGTTSKDC